MKHKIFNLGFFVALVILSPNAHAKYFPQGLFESAKIPDTVLSVQWVDFDQDGQQDLIYLTKENVVFTHVNKSSGELKTILQLKAKSFEEFHRLSVADFNQDGELEFLVNGFSAKNIVSWIFVLNGKNLEQKQVVNSLVLPFNLTGTTQLYAQNMYQGFRWSKKIHQLKWDGKKYTENALVDLKKGIGQETASLFSLLGLGESQIEITSDGKLELIKTATGQTLWRSGVDYGGAYDFVENQNRDPLGVKTNQRFFIQPRFLWQNQAGQNKIIIVKNEGYLKAAVGAVPAMKYAQLVSLDLQNDRLQELKVSPRVDGAITDIQWVDFDNNGTLELTAVILVRKLGYWDSLRKQDSVIIVLPADF